MFEENPLTREDITQIQNCEDEVLVNEYFDKNPFTNEELLWGQDIEENGIIYDFEDQVGNGANDVDLPYTLNERSRKINRRFQTEEISFTARINPSQIPIQYSNQFLSGAITFLKMIFEALLVETTKNLEEEDFIRICIFSDNLDKPISTCLIHVKNMTVEFLLATIMKVLQSKDSIPVDDESLRFDILTVKNPRGGGKRKLSSIDTNCLKKKSIVTIPTTSDNLCCARAIIVGKAFLEKHPQYKTIRDGRCQVQKRMAEQLHTDTGVPRGLCGYNEIRKFEDHLDIQIHVVSANEFNKVTYKGPNRTKKIFLYYHNEHFDAITNIKAFYGRTYYCTTCDKGFDHVERHKCSVRCNVCFREDCILDTKLVCPLCHRTCKSEECFAHHRELNGKDKSYCEQFYECPDCSKFLCSKIRPSNLHRCGEIYCSNCKKYFLEKHLCFLKKIAPKKSSEKLIFFDFETDQSTGEHEVNFAMAMYSSGEEFVFKGYDACEQFCNFLFSDQHKGYTAVAHNMKAFDGQFIMAYLLKQGMKPKIIPNGSKVMKIEFTSLDIKIIDSYNFLPMSLAKLPKTFGINELEKGYFPHLFNKSENQSYTGDVPKAEYYNPEYMSESDREKFYLWYVERKKDSFNFQEEIAKYCRSDVDILRRCCLLFRDEFLKISDIDPFQYTTIASACMATFRSKFIEDNVIGMVPVYGYVNTQNSSKSAIQWLDFISFKENIDIQHAGNGYGEKKIGNISVDGFCSETNTVFQFLGCFFHGCPRCYPDDDMINPLNGEYMWVLKAKVRKTEAKIKNLGLNYREIWEHNFENQKKTCSELKDFLKNHEFVSRLNPRDSFFGGRTNATRLFYEGRAKYIDFTSLYPYVNKYCRYPVKHPNVITSDFTSIDKYFGIVKCKVLPPRKLYLPVLPYRWNGKLIFPLCRLCLETNQKLTCHHSNDDRSFIGTWVTEELKKAVTKGYEIIKIYEVYDFPESRIGLFATYIDTFLKIKQESSGFPPECTTDEAKDNYIKRYKEHEGIFLDKSSIVSNPGRRQVAKLCLNSFWGRWGMCENKTQLKYVTELVQFNKMLADPTITVTDMYLPTEEVAAIQYCWKNECVPQTDKTNIFLATFTTSWARLKLYSELEKLGENVLYFDTDSIIYSSTGSNDPAIGSYLGEFTDELDGKYIKVFVSGGAKNYAFERNDGVKICKIRGFTLNYRNSQVLNFNSMKELVQDLDLNTTLSVFNPMKIVTDAKRRKVLNTSEEKKYRLVYDKRIIQPDFNTLPYGY